MPCPESPRSTRGRIDGHAGCACVAPSEIFAYGLTVDLCIGGARNEQGMTRAPQAPGLAVVPHDELLGEPVAVFEQ